MRIVLMRLLLSDRSSHLYNIPVPGFHPSAEWLSEMFTARPKNLKKYAHRISLAKASRGAVATFPVGTKALLYKPWQGLS
jgi:hypothetical protein